ncbi:MAG: glycosyltransferase [Candidatus Humimicrobiaceae bacterium]
MKVSFITTVYNEKETIIPFLKSLAGQSCLPDEAVIVDGGSSDGTYGLIEGFLKKGNLNYKLMRKAKASISEGRNVAISSASNRVICVSDAGCILDKGWLAEIKKDVSPGRMVGGYNKAIAETFLEKCLAAAIMPKVSEIKRDKYMPSSRNLCFFKPDWNKAGRYPEQMDYGEDMKFNFNAKKAGISIIFNPAAIVHWKMRNSLKDIFRQFFRYAKGDALGRMYLHRHFIRFASVLIMAAIAVISVIFSPYFLLLYVLMFAIYLFTPYRRIPYYFRKEGVAKKIYSFIFMPLLLVFIDLAKLFGYIYGIIIRK